MSAQVRSLKSVPWPLYVVLAATLAAQLWWATSQRSPAVTVRQLPVAPSASTLVVASFGEPGVMARVLMLWLQGFDYQPGVSLGLIELDYERLEQWLTRMLELDPSFQYPLLAAARLYGEVNHPDKQRQMIQFIAQHFAARPVEHWQWMAHAVYIAQHRIKDNELALSLARALAAAPASAQIPSWARQMHIFILENMGELESAKVLLGGLLDSGEISDPHERWFLSHRLHQLEQAGNPSDGAGELDHD